MKKLVLLPICVLLSITLIFSQSQEVIRIKAGDDIPTGYSPYGFYRFPAFSEGTAYFKNGGTTTARFNYHILNDEMQFINDKGDTMAIAEPFSIKYITLDSTLFFYSEGYLEVLENHESLKLGRKLRLNTKWEKIGGYGQPSPSGSIRTPNKLILGNTGKSLSINQDLLIQKEYTYYWLDKYNTALKATKANLLTLLLPDRKNDIEDYLKKNRVDFRKESDLKKLLTYSLSGK